MPRRLAALLLDLLLLQLLLLGGSGECITREHAAPGTVAAVIDPHGGHGSHAAHAIVAGQHVAGAPAEDDANSVPDGGTHCLMATSCATASLAAGVPAMDDAPIARATLVAPRVTRPASPAFSPEPPPPRA